MGTANSCPLPERADIVGASRGLIRSADYYEDADAQINEMFDREMD